MAELDELSSEELFNSALSDEQPEATEQVAEVEASDDQRARDELGRFAPKSEEVEAKPEAEQAKPVEQPVESQGVKQLREALERANRRADEVERRLLSMQPKLEPVAKPDIFEKPDEFVRANINEVVAPLQQQFSSFIESVSRRDAIKEHGQERVTEAFTALDQAAKVGDPQALAIVQAVKQSMDPFGDIVNWYRGAEASRDPDAFFQRKLEEALKDEKFKGELLTKLRPGTTEQQQAQPVIKLPPSIGKVPSSHSASTEVADMSDAGLFAHAMR